MPANSYCGNRQRKRRQVDLPFSFWLRSASRSDPAPELAQADILSGLMLVVIAGIVVGTKVIFHQAKKAEAQFYPCSGTRSLRYTILLYYAQPATNYRSAK